MLRLLYAFHWMYRLYPLPSLSNGRPIPYILPLCFLIFHLSLAFPHSLQISIGIVSGRSNTTFDNCTFEANHADGTGGITIDGNNDLTADELNFGFVFLSNSIFTNNVALRGGAAVHCASGLTFTTRVRVIITSTAFVGNKGR